MCKSIRRVALALLLVLVMPALFCEGRGFITGGDDRPLPPDVAAALAEQERREELLPHEYPHSHDHELVDADEEDIELLKMQHHNLFVYYPKRDGVDVFADAVMKKIACQWHKEQLEVQFVRGTSYDGPTPRVIVYHSGTHDELVYDPVRDGKLPRVHKHRSDDDHDDDDDDDDADNAKVNSSVVEQDPHMHDHHNAGHHHTFTGVWHDDGEMLANWVNFMVGQ
jgi:hypothetical protein